MGLVKPLGDIKFISINPRSPVKLSATVAVTPKRAELK
jgi:hypothetical protein